MSGALLCYFGTINRILIQALCVILPTGQWGTPRYSQPATEEWLNLIAICGTWNTSNIENHVLFRDKLSSLDICIMCDTPNRPVRNATLIPTGHWGMAAFASNMGHVKHIEHCKPCLGALMCYFGTNNRLLIYASCVILPTGHAVRNTPLLPTGHWGMDAFDSTIGPVKHITHWKPSRGA